jgi:hypothetical protein
MNEGNGRAHAVTNNGQTSFRAGLDPSENGFAARNHAQIAGSGNGITESPDWVDDGVGVPDDASVVCEVLRCLEANNYCDGPVEYRMALRATGVSFPRCQRHWQKRLEIQEGINARYPDQGPAEAGAVGPYAGERPDED